MNQYDPNRPFVPEQGVIGNSPLNPNHPSSQGYQPPAKKHTVRNIVLLVVMLFVGVITAAVLSGGVQPETAQAPVSVTSTAGAPVVTNEPSTVPSAATKPSPKPTVKPSPKPTKAAPKLTMSQEQAIGSAQSYLEMQGFSRKGLIKQLSSEYGEGFSKADATFAVDHLKVNWYEQAARSAKSYLEMEHFSRAGLIKQLESAYGEGFTHSQAVYGVNKAGL